jgi:uncharacterized membrane protein YdjX (TVP38/TMEM64 family)
MTSSRRIGLLRIAAALALVVVIGLGAAAWWNHAVGVAPTSKGIEVEIRSWGHWAAVASIGLMIAHSLVPFPAEFVTFANGMLFGPVWGVAITWTGAMLGAALAFALARWCGRPFVDALMNERHRAAMDRWARRQGIGVLLLSRLMPLISFNVINYAAGLTPVSWWTFLWTTGLGILPITTLLVVTGDQVWNGSGNAWIYLVAVAAVGTLLWFLLARRQRAGG